MKALPLLRNSLLTASIFLVASCVAQNEPVSQDEGVLNVGHFKHVLSRLGRIPMPTELQFDQSPFTFVDNQIALDQELVAVNDPVILNQYAVARKSAEFLNAPAIPENTKVYVHETEEVDVVIYDLDLPPNTLGGDFLYQVFIDRRTNEVIGVLISD